jgi:hypothetical protein
VLGAFFDDSETHTSSPVVAIGGLLGTSDQWDLFAEAWDKLLEHPLPGKPNLNQFHLSPCRAGKGEFQDYSLPERDHLTHLFRQIILNTGMVTLAAVVNRRAWNELVTGKVAEQLGDPVEMCFVKCIDLMIEIIRLRRSSEHVFIFFDEGTRSQLETWGRLYQVQAKRYPEIAGIAFAPVSRVVALQGADMIATESYQFAQEWLKNRENPAANAHFNEFINQDLSVGLVFDRDQIGELVQRDQEDLKRRSA